MSYDLRLWTVNRVPTTTVQALLPDARIREGCVQVESKGWVVTIEESVEVEAEDIPDEVMAAVPGIAWLNSVNIEPIGAPGAVKRRRQTPSF
jgi:hypothetical protein